MSLTSKITQRGFTLLEVMVALVIFSIGLIGLAGLQAVSLQNNQVAYSRSIATQLAYDIADRIRNNRITAYAYTFGTTTTTNTDCVTAACSAAQMMQADLFQWEQAIASPQNGLLNAQGSISSTGAPPNITYTIAIGWDENKQGLSGTYNCNATTPSPAGVSCVRIVVQP